ncbi:MAG: hypothetical protein CVV64_00930 [Candidatus Wallbacteria bacterium HGW-Wallbacteria-1]|uniref:Uncharacterized protein n=1 Tax=Candidatus Wallbacteria bacterium HGW-Wallbacteria-1 TaxID=2013854 RepID=A0A2N1PUJ4_9BACT|nr:MAG: hypothetical protein CVV64_00930 [Candidatus Wallbacteria bacterium HGW-Wallbacteria-1]
MGIYSFCLDDSEGSATIGGILSDACCYISLCLIFLCVSSIAAHAAPLGPTAIVDMPSTVVSEATSYETSGGLKYISYTKSFLMGNVEAGGIKELTGSDENLIFFGKMRVFPETDIIPMAAVGVTGFGSDVRDPSYYLAISKSLTSFGLTLHGGYFRQGRLKAIPGSSADSSWYGGMEFGLMNTFSLVGEYWKEKVNLGVRMNLGPGLSASAFARDYENNSFDKLDYQISYGVRM